MALFTECAVRYASNLLDTADIVRDAIYRQLTVSVTKSTSKQRPATHFASGIYVNE
jgi:hypothetical protein